MTRFGLVGTGHWASTVHAAALAARTDGEFVGVWGRTPSRAAAVADRYATTMAATPGELFAEADVVAFAVPPDVQPALAGQAAAAGCHLLLEKPVALDVTAADDLAEVVRAHHVAAAVFFTARYVPEVAAWMASARRGGPWLGGRATWFGANAEPDSPYRDSAWRREHGGLWDVGPHGLAVLLPLLGPVTDVAAMPGPGDVVHAVLRHAGGAASTVALGLTLPPAAALVEAAVFGASGWSVMPDVEPDPVAAMDAAVDDLLASARTGAPASCGIELGRDIVHVLAQVEEALG